ncbi:MAG: hypothetical protein DMG61_11485 [Acidobacteria bacterium]|nr:MAG: hypothetical protein DMG61_11485 [Acidobacteriota bacterium]PYY19196.1 MAG: hypothetical protein DMG60_05225 [Acidobacteriota bacterium]
MARQAQKLEAISGLSTSSVSQEDAKYLISKLELDFKTVYDRWRQEVALWISFRPRHDLTIESLERVRRPSQAPFWANCYLSLKKS